MTLFARLGRSTRGATMVEFALLAPVLLTFLFGIIETGRLLWTRQALDEIAFATARCMAVSEDCDTEAKAKIFAEDRASDSTFAIEFSSISATRNVTCNSLPGAARVTISYAFTSPTGNLIPELSSVDLISEGCFPIFE